MRNDIRTLRTVGGLSQQQLAEAMDVSRQTINSIEKERYTPSLPLAIALARFFGLTVEEVFHVAGHDGDILAAPPRARVDRRVAVMRPPRPSSGEPFPRRPRGSRPW